jgi:hypothetical protein
MYYLGAKNYAREHLEEKTVLGVKNTSCHAAG